MKKFSLAIYFICFVTIISGCSDNKNINPNIKSPSPSDKLGVNLTINDYYPFKANTKYVYQGQGNEFASYYVYTDYIDDNRIQLRFNNGGTETIKVIENKSGQLSVLLSQGESYFRENMLKKILMNQEIILQEPLKKGTEWLLNDGRKRYISNDHVMISTPMGIYDALEVTTESRDGNNIDYYAQGVGLVKTVFQASGLEVTSTLTKIEEDVPLVQTVKFYYPDVGENKIYYTNKNLIFKTNDITKNVFEKSLKEVPSDSFGAVLGPNVRIKSLYLNKDKAVYVDFTKEFQTEMNAGSGYESMILQCITNTFANYYGVDKIYLTVEGNPYTSGHISMKKGEFLKVNLENCVEISNKE